MKNKYFKIILSILLSYSLAVNVTAQNIAYDVDITNIYSSECGDCNGPPDYQYFFKLYASGSDVANWDPYYLDNPWCAWIGESNYSFYANSNASASTYINLQYRAYEDDSFPCGADDGVCGSYASANGNITLTSTSAGSWHTYSNTRVCDGITWGVQYRFLWNYLPLNTPLVPTSFGSNCGLSLNATSSNQTAVQWYWQTSTSGTDFSNAANNPPSVPNGATTYYLRPYGINSGLWGTASTGLALSKSCNFWCHSTTLDPPNIGPGNRGTASPGGGDGTYQNNFTLNTSHFASNSLVVDVNTDASNYGSVLQLATSTANHSLVNDNNNNWTDWDLDNPNVTWYLALDNPWGYNINPGPVTIEVCSCKPASYGAITSSTGSTACPDEIFTLIHNGSTSDKEDEQGYGEEMRWFTGSCGGTLVGTGLSIGVTGPGTEISRTYYAQFFTNGNACGGCESYTITYQDNTKPVVVCPSPQTDVLDNACSWLVPDYRSLATITDNCVAFSDLTITQSPVSGTLVSSSHGASENVTITANDGYGNTESCTFAVVLSDNIAPSVVCKNYTLNLNALGSATLIPSNIDDGSTDNCTTPTLSLSKTLFTCADVGTNTVTLTGNDGNGNTSTCSATVTVVDNVNPTAICQNYILMLDGSGNGTLIPANVNNGSNDACGIATMSLSKTAFNCLEVGSNTVTLTVTDNNSNVSTCTANVTVQDGVDPVAICQNATVTLDASGNASVTPAQINNLSTDNCGITLMTAAPNTFTCADLGSNNVFLNVEDAQGNSNFCISQVTVNQANSTGPINIIASDSFVCNGAPVTLTQTGGVLGAGANYEWYSGSCGGTSVGTGSSITINPSSTTTYYARAESVCGDILSPCISVDVTTPSTAPDASSVLATSTSSFTCEVSGPNWHHFYNSKKELLASINSNSQDLGEVTVEIILGDSGPFGQGLPPGVCGYPGASAGEYVMPRYWDISVEDQPSSDVDVIFYYKNSDVASLVSTVNGLNSNYTTCWGDVNVEADLMMTVNHGSSVETFPSLVFSNGPNVSLGQRQIEFKLDEFSQGKLHSKAGIYAENALPVELKDFTAKVIDNKFIKLNWTTATEINNAGFELQRSTDGITFNKIAWLEGSGNTNQEQSYNFEDNQVTVGVYYYRLKQVDFDNEYEFSEIKSATILGKEGVSLSFFIPNPTFNNTQLNFNLVKDEKVIVKIIDNIGRMIDSKELEMLVGSQSISFNTENYTPGIYTAKIFIGKEEFTRRLVVRK